MREQPVVLVQPGDVTGGPGEEKREIIRRLREYRKTGGPGSLIKLAEAIRPRGGITDGLLREMCQYRVGEMPISQWRRLARALDRMEAKGRRRCGKCGREREIICAVDGEAYCLECFVKALDDLAAAARREGAGHAEDRG